MSFWSKLDIAVCCAIVVLVLLHFIFGPFAPIYCGPSSPCTLWQHVAGFIDAILIVCVWVCLGLLGLSGLVGLALAGPLGIAILTTMGRK